MNSEIREASLELSRRKLLLGAAAAGMAPTLSGLPLAVPSISPDREDSGFVDQEEKTVGYAVLGLGGYATGQIMPAFARAKKSKLVALISGTPEKLSKYGDQYGIAANRRFSYKEMDRIREIPEIDVVYVITPPGTHAEFAIRAAGAGKHVLSEKPMAATSPQALEMIRACRAAKRLLMIGYRSHYEPNNMRAIQACGSGELGKLRSFASEHGFQGPLGTWRTSDRSLAGGGALWDIGIYALQASMYLTGETPTRVYAMGDKLDGDPRFKEVDDVTHLMLDFPGGSIANIATGYSWAGANNYRMIGTKSTLFAEPATSYSGNRLKIGGKDATAEGQDQFSAQLDHMSSAVLSNAPTDGTGVRTPGQMGLRDLRIMEAALLSAKENRPIELKDLTRV